MISTTKFNRVTHYKNELIWLAIGFVAIFISLSLYSFSPHDASRFFYSTKMYATRNVCGPIGATLAAWMFYFFGLGAFLIAPCLLFTAYLYQNRQGWHDEWERYFAIVAGITSFSALCTMHKWFFHVRMIPGGVVGFYTARFLYSFFDQIGTFLFLYFTLYVCLIVMLRFSYMGFITSLMYAVEYTAQKAREHSVVSRGVIAIRGFISLLAQPFILFGKFSLRVLDGSIFDQPVVANSQADEVEHQKSKMNNKKLYNQFSFSAYALPQKGESISHSSSESTSHMEEKVVADPYIDEHEYGLPSMDIFIGVKAKKEDAAYKQELQERAQILEEKLERFGVLGKVVSIKSGPVVTLFEYQPGIDTKLSKILSLEDDLALALRALSIRIIAPIPGRSVVGFEVSNKDRKDVLLGHVIQSEEYQNFAGALPLILGEDTIGNNVVVDLAKMPHLLVAGSTGSGKSVALNAMLMSLLCKCTPDQVKLILIDPKRLEFASYADMAHLLFPIITHPKKVAPILKWLVHQMEERYEMMAECNARNIEDYNTILKNQGKSALSYIVVVIDELSDLMLNVGREIEDLITRITQMARAAGIHMIVATQRPSVDVITGLIKVNFPSRISFRVTSKVDSRTILDCGGADKLLGRGDMLFLDSTASALRRVHGAYVSNNQIEQVVAHVRAQKQAEYLDITNQLKTQEAELLDEDESLYLQVLDFLNEVEEVSISLLQRKFRIGYNRSARIIDRLESQGLIMPADGGKTRRVVRP